MSKLRGSTALSRRKNKEKKPEPLTQETKAITSDGDHKDKITTVATRRNITTGSSPVPLRLTANDKAELNLWLEELELAAGKPVSSAKLLRGLIHMRSKINTKKLIMAIKEIS